MICREFSLVNQSEHGGIAIPLMCRSWGCDYCRPIRQRQLFDLAEHGTPTRFITLTASPATGISPADRARKLARAWRLVVARAKRQFKLPEFNYLAVFEATKRGEPHLHILCRVAFIPQRWLSAQMNTIMASPIVDIRIIKSAKQAARYIAKYVGKEPHHFSTCKRYWHTKNWINADPAPVHTDTFRGPGWSIVEKDLPEIYRQWKLERKIPTIVLTHRNILPRGLSMDVVSWGLGTPPAAAQPADAGEVERCYLHMGSRA